MSSAKQLSVKQNWQSPRYQGEWRNVCALLPAYLPDGTNGSLVYYADGTVEAEPAQLGWVLDNLLACCCSSKLILQQQSRWLLEQQGQKQQIRLPLLLPQGLYLMPVKARPPHSRHHGADGYVVYSAITAVEKTDHGTGSNLLLKNGQALLVLDSLRTLRKNLRMTAQLAAALEQRNAAP